MLEQSRQVRSIYQYLVIKGFSKRYHIHKSPTATGRANKSELICSFFPEKTTSGSETGTCTLSHPQLPDTAS